MVVKLDRNAQKKLWEIGNYYILKANSKVAQSIVKQIRRTIDRLLIFPHMGSVEWTIKQTNIPYRSIVAHPYYKIIYYINNNVIHVIDIWDCRQDPDKISEAAGQPKIN